MSLTQREVERAFFRARGADPDLLLRLDKLTAERDTAASMVADLDGRVDVLVERCDALRAERDAAREGLLWVPPQRSGPTLRDVLDALPPGGSVTFTAPRED